MYKYCVIVCSFFCSTVLGVLKLFEKSKIEMLNFSWMALSNEIFIAVITKMIIHDDNDNYDDDDSV